MGSNRCVAERNLYSGDTRERCARSRHARRAATLRSLASYAVGWLSFCGLHRLPTGGRFGIGLLLAALIVLGVHLSFPPAAVAAEGDLQVVQVGWDGAVVPGSWTPVRLKVTGGSTDVNARVEVVLKNRYQPGPQSTPIEYPIAAYGQDVPLPAGVSKEVTVWVFSDPYSSGTGSLNATARMEAGGRLLAEQRLEFKNTRTPFWPVVGVLAEAPAVARTISQLELPFQGLPIPVGVARLTAADLPPSAERLNALAALLVQGNVAGTLTGEQRRAVQGWVAAGGHLVLVGGPDAPRAAAVLPSGTLPVTFSGAESAGDLSALARWAEVREASPGTAPVATFRAEGGSVLAGTGDRPLAWRLGVGRGSVTLLAADPSLEPLASWSGTPALMRKALEPALPTAGGNEKLRYMQMQERDAAMRMQGAVEALPPEAFPGWQTVALILGGFALVVGPLLHLLLSRVDRRGLVWLAVPAAAVLLSGALYYVGIGRGGQDVLGHVVSYVRLDPNAGQAQQTLVAGFFAPTHERLAVSLAGDVPLRAASRPMGAYYGPGGVPSLGSTEPPFHVISGRDTRAEFTSGQWTMRTVMVDRTLGRESGGVAASLGLEEGLIKGSLRNDTPYPLEDAAVLVGQSLVKLGNLAPGQTVPVVLDPGAVPNPFQGGFPLSYRLFGRTATSAVGAGVAIAVPAAARPAAVVPVPAQPLTPTPAKAASGAPASTTPSAAPSASAAANEGPSPTPTTGPTAMPAPTVAPASVRSVPALPPMPYERMELPPDPEVHRRVRLMDAVINRPRPGPGAPMMPLTFLAFTRVPVATDLPSAGSHPVFHLSILEQPLHLDPEPGHFSMPASLAPPEVLGQSGGMGGGGDGTIYWVEVYGGSVSYGFRPPLPPKATVEALLVTTRQIGQSAPAAQGRGAPPPANMTPGPAEEGVFSVYNWQSAAWEPLPGGREEVRLAPASPYLGPEDLIRIDVRSGPDRVVRVVQPEVAVEGRIER